MLSWWSKITSELISASVYFESRVETSPASVAAPVSISETSTCWYFKLCLSSCDRQRRDDEFLLIKYLIIGYIWSTISHVKFG